MSGEHDTVRHGVEDACQLLRFVRWPSKVPEISQFLWIEPRLDMTEVTVINFKVGSKSGHEFNDERRVLLWNVVTEINAKPEIVIAPYSDGLCLAQQTTRLLNTLSCLEHV